MSYLMLYDWQLCSVHRQELETVASTATSPAQTDFKSTRWRCLYLDILASLLYSRGRECRPFIYRLWYGMKRGRNSTKMTSFDMKLWMEWNYSGVFCLTSFWKEEMQQFTLYVHISIRARPIYQLFFISSCHPIWAKPFAKLIMQEKMLG